MLVGIVGCGNIAANHVVAFREAGVEVVACADVDAGRAEEFARAHGIPAAVADVDAVLDRNVDLVSVCTPTRPTRPW